MLKRKSTSLHHIRLPKHQRLRSWLPRWVAVRRLLQHLTKAYPCKHHGWHKL